MKKGWEASLTARFIVLLLLALAASQLLTLGISWDERSTALRDAAQGEFLSRGASLALLLDSTPVQMRNDILNVSNTTYGRFWVDEKGPGTPSQWWIAARDHLLAPLSVDGRYEDSRLRSELLEVDSAPVEFDQTSQWAVPAGEVWPSSRKAEFLYVAQLKVMGIATPLRDGQWLHAVYAKPVEGSSFGRKAVFSWVITALALSAIAVLVARQISRPLQQLATMAERLGRGENTHDLPESGPADVRRTARAFNQMQRRIRRFVDDRTCMLAAIGHDLRTPLTTLRLRTEFVADEDLKRRMLSTIEEIGTMTEAAIHYARGEYVSEATRRVDLAALAESLCEDLSEVGQNVIFEDGPKVTLNCRPDALRRALRNLIENAVRYGSRASVRASETSTDVLVEVQDEGPGIPTEAIEHVFAPFYRMEHSRNRSTGGVGLGLATARSIARQHGGDVTLLNSANGLTARITLPKA